MKLKALYKKLFLTGEWRIAYRQRSCTDFYSEPFISIRNNNDYWFADPLLFQDKGKTFLYCEAFDRKELKGKLGYFEIKDGTVSDFVLVIDENYHMSFPYVIKSEGTFYMIPESGENFSLDLYKAKKFPSDWKKEKTLIEGYNYVDPIIVEVEDMKFLFVYIDKRGCYQTRIYRILQNFELEFFQSIDYDKNIGRSAGKVFFNENNEIIRPVQMSEGEYGKEILFYRLEYRDGTFVETYIGKINNKSVKVNGCSEGVNRIHTYSRCESFEAIDYTVYKFDLFKRVKILLRKYKRLKRGN